MQGHEPTGGRAREGGQEIRSPVGRFGNSRNEKQLKKELELRRPGRTRGVNVAGFDAQNKSNKRLKRPS